MFAGEGRGEFVEGVGWVLAVFEVEEAGCMMVVSLASMVVEGWVGGDYRLLWCDRIAFRDWKVPWWAMCAVCDRLCRRNRRGLECWT